MASSVESLPSVLIVPVHSSPSARQIIQGILKEEQSGNAETESVPPKSWTIENKYYKAQVLLDVLDEISDKNSSSDVLDRAEALILTWDPTKDAGLTEVKLKYDLVKQCEAEVQLLVCRGCDEATRLKAVTWCLNNQVELVMLDEEVDNEDDEDDSGAGDDHQDMMTKREAVAYDRVREALQTHMWSNMTQKIERKKSIPDTKESSRTDQENESNGAIGDKEESFANLLGQLSQMKRASLDAPRDTRLDFAEKMTTQIMELLDLSDDSEEGEQ